MAKKSDLEADHNAYRMYAGQAAAAARAQSLNSAVNHSLDSLDSLSGYADYERRYSKSDRVTLPTLDVIFAYAPALFRSDALRRVEQLLRDAPKIPKKVDREIAGELDACHAAMRAALRFWDDCLAGPAGSLGHPPHGLQGVVDAWSKLGLERFRL